MPGGGVRTAPQDKKIGPLLSVPSDACDLGAAFRARALHSAPAILEGDALRVLHINHHSIFDTIRLYHFNTSSGNLTVLPQRLTPRPMWARVRLA